MRAPEFWLRDDWTARCAAVGLTPLGWLYGAVTDWKRAHAAAYTPRAKVVCIGNLTVGGSGKTPVVLAVLQMLLAQGLRVAVLSRGYGGHQACPTFVDRERHGAADVGDEPLLLAAAALVIVARDRRLGAELADTRDIDVIVMDDGHQNFGLAKNLSVVVVDAQTGFGNGRIVPAGPLRESPRNGLARADAVVLVGQGNPELPGYTGPILRAQIVPSDGSNLRDRKVVAFAGIGRPDKFFDTLRTLGADLVETIAFEDHHVFDASEIAMLRIKAKESGARLVTTEKDFVRLPPGDREDISVLPVHAVFDEPERLQRLLDGALQRPVKK